MVAAPVDIPARILELLARCEVRYELTRAPLPGGFGNALRATLLRDAEGVVLAVYPQSHVLEVSMLNAVLGRRLCPLLAEEAAGVFADCDPAHLPPFGPLYGVETCVERAVDALQVVLIETGRAGTRAQLSGVALSRLLAGAKRGLHFAAEGTREYTGGRGFVSAPRLNLVARLQSPDSLPTTPERARRLLALRGDERAGPRELEQLLRDDPSTSAQLLRYANSPLLGHRCRTESLEQSIVLLGYEVALNVALGVSMAQALRMPAHGPLSVARVWRHAVYSATLCEQLARHLPRSLGVQRGLAYLAGLLQDIGYIYLAQVFNKELFWLSRELALNPHLSPIEAEREVLGITHSDLGAMLLCRWGLPEELVVAVEQHEAAPHSGVQWAYCDLVVLANRALAHQGLGESHDDGLAHERLARLALDAATVMGEAGRVLNARASLDGLARSLGA